MLFDGVCEGVKCTIELDGIEWVILHDIETGTQVFTYLNIDDGQFLAVEDCEAARHWLPCAGPFQVKWTCEYVVEHYNEAKEDYDTWSFPCTFVMLPHKISIKRTGSINPVSHDTMQATPAITRFFQQEELEIDITAECAFTVACCMLKHMKK